MILNLEARGTLRVAGVRDMTVEVLEGRVWLTRQGSAADVVLARGAHYRVAGEGVVLVGLERRARLDLRPVRKAAWWRRCWRACTRALDERRAAQELARLPDRMLRDMGLSRDRIREVV